MIKEALAYIVGLAKPEVQQIGDSIYSDKPLNRVSYKPKAKTIHMTTLSSLVDYISSGVDKMPCPMIVHVKSPTEVSLYSALDHERCREALVDVEAKLPMFNFNQFIDHERFCINLQSKFINTPDRALLLKFAGTVETGTIAEYGDDGVTQKATVKTGIASKGEAIVPNPVILKPFRTFIEIEQPASSFVFRMQGNNSVQCGLFEADGGAWELEAMQNIQGFLEEALDGIDNFIVIS